MNEIYNNNNLKSNYNDWYRKAITSLKNISFEKLISKNADGISIEPFYTEENSTQTHFTFPNQNCKIISPYYKSFQNEVNGFILYKNEELKIINHHLFYLFSNIAYYKELNLDTHNSQYILFDFFTYFEKNGHWINSKKIDIQLYKELIHQLKIKSKYCIDITLHQNAGATPCQQIAFALAKLNELVGFFGKEILSQIIIKTSIGSDFFGEIAKLKSLRILFESICAEYKINNNLTLVCETTLRNKSTIDKENNLIRSTIESIAAIMGGSNFLHILPYQNWKKPTELDLEIAYKQFLILSNESSFTFFDDATSHSYFIENLIVETSKKAWKLFQDIEKENGYLVALEKGIIKNQIEDSHKKEIEQFRSNKIELIGINNSQSTQIGFEYEDIIYPYISPKRLATEYENTCKNLEK